MPYKPQEYLQFKRHIVTVYYSVLIHTCTFPKEARSTSNTQNKTEHNKHTTPVIYGSHYVRLNRLTLIAITKTCVYVTRAHGADKTYVICIPRFLLVILRGATLLFRKGVLVVSRHTCTDVLHGVCICISGGTGY